MSAPADPNAIIEALAPLLGLEVAEADRAGVALHLATAARLYALVEAAAVADAEEPAAVFRPDPVRETVG